MVGCVVLKSFQHNMGVLLIGCVTAAILLKAFLVGEHRHEP